jgi:hypothetical protein
MGASTSETIDIAVCNSFISPDGNTYTSSGVYMDTIPNDAGCDSVITTNLSVDEVPTISHFTSRGTDKFRVNWNYPLAATVNDTNFRVRTWESGFSGLFTDKSQVPSKLHKKITGLSPETRYKNKVGFACPDGSFIWGGTDSVKTKILPCPTPTGLGNDGDSQPSSFNLQWDDMSAIEYKVRSRVLGTDNWSFASSATNSKTISGLLSDTMYEVEVKGQCADRWSGYTGPVILTTSGEAVFRQSALALTEASLSSNYNGGILKVSFPYNDVDYRF